MNLGIHLSFLPIASSDTLPDVRRFREVHCEFRRRLAPGEKTHCWWKYGGIFTSPEKGADSLVETYFNVGEPYFAGFKTVHAIASVLEYEALEAHDFLDVFGGVPRVRGALTAARIHAHLGDVARRMKFAKLGLKHIGRAVALREELERLAEAWAEPPKVK